MEQKVISSNDEAANLEGDVGHVPTGQEIVVGLFGKGLLVDQIAEFLREDRDRVRSWLQGRTLVDDSVMERFGVTYTKLDAAFQGDFTILFRVLKVTDANAVSLHAILCAPRIDQSKLDAKLKRLAPAINRYARFRASPSITTDYD